MTFLHFFFVFIILLICPKILIQAQQPYIRNLSADCSITNTSTSVLGYACNGVDQTCQAYLTFLSKAPYNTVVSISNLLNANATELAQLNSVSESINFETDEMVFVPTRCSCLGDQFYQANATYVTQSNDTLLLIATNTFEGLSTCHAIQNEKSDPTNSDIKVGQGLTVPLRCACPTEKQAAAGVNYLLSYLVTSGTFVSGISARFRVDTGLTLEANGLSEQDSTIYPFTTLLVPLSIPPLIPQTIAPPPPPSTTTSPPPTTSVKDHKLIYIIVGVLGGVGVTFIVAVLFCFLRRKKMTQPVVVVPSASHSIEAVEKPLVEKLDVDEDLEFTEILRNIAQSLIVYTFDELKFATQDFSPNCLIKGSVYQGNINGDHVAIKKMHGDVSSEIRLLNTIHHHSLIRLIGACFNDGGWYLVYEFAVNGPLSDWIYYNAVSSNKFLDWMQRIQIALDVANGLDYLHNYTTPPYVYKNLESSNILLDGEYRAKITNFDLARSSKTQDGQFTLTRHIVGNRGYMSPEYLENGLISTKFDVYGFGVLLLEIVTGKHVSDHEKANTNLSEVLHDVLEEDKINGNEKWNDFIDQRLQGNYPQQHAMSVVKLIDACLDKDPSARPDMNGIAQCLSSILTPLDAMD